MVAYNIRHCDHVPSLQKEIWLNASAYLPGRGAAVIMKAALLGRGLSIALRSGWPLRLPQMWATRRRHFCVWGTAFALSPAKFEKLFQNTKAVTLLRFKNITMFPVYHGKSHGAVESTTTWKDNNQRNVGSILYSKKGPAKMAMLSKGRMKLFAKWWRKRGLNYVVEDIHAHDPQ